jgi:hypothetical protein
MARKPFDLHQARVDQWRIVLIQCVRMREN